MDAVQSSDDLSVCAACKRRFVVPVSVLDVVDRGRFVVELECNNCGHATLSVHGDQELESLDRQLDRSAAHLRDFADAMTESRELELIDRFVGALHADEILPEDF